MKTNPVTLIIVTLVVAAGAYWFMSTGEGEQPALTTSSSQNAAQTQFQVLVSELQPISFDTAIFENPRFVALVDLTTPIQPEASGRPDPFAP